MNDDEIVNVKKSYPKEYFFEIDITEPYLTLKKPPLNFDKLNKLWKEALIKDGVINVRTNLEEDPTSRIRNQGSDEML